MPRPATCPVWRGFSSARNCASRLVSWRMAGTVTVAALAKKAGRPRAGSPGRLPAGAERGDVDAVGAGAGAVAPGAVLGQVDERIVAVVGVADVDPVELL